MAKNTGENMSATDAAGVSIGHSQSVPEGMDAIGTYHLEIYECAGGKLLYAEDFPNVVCTVGKNLALDTILSGSSYTVTGPYLGLISSTSYSAVSASDTMASHSGWLEAGNANTPTFSARGTPSFSSASGGSKTTSSAVSFTMTSSGTLKGAFLTYGSGAVSTIDSTAGTLLSAGLFTGGDQAVSSGNVVNVSYTLSM